MKLKQLFPILSFSTLTLSGCGVWQAASDGTVDAYRAVSDWRVKVVDIDVRANADLDRDASGHPASVAVRVYQLKDRRRFDGASLDDLASRDQTVLATDVQASVAAVVNPGASVSISEPMQKDTAFIAVAALYRNPDKAGSWKQVIAAKKLPDHGPLKLILADGKLDLPDEKASRKNAR